MAIEKIIAGGNLQVKSISAVDENGEIIRSVEFKVAANAVKFRTRSKEFEYHLLLMEG